MYINSNLFSFFAFYNAKDYKIEPKEGNEHDPTYLYPFTCTKSNHL